MLGTHKTDLRLQVLQIWRHHTGLCLCASISISDVCLVILRARLLFVVLIQVGSDSLPMRSPPVCSLVPFACMFC